MLMDIFHLYIFFSLLSYSRHLVGKVCLPQAGLCCGGYSLNYIEQTSLALTAGNIISGPWSQCRRTRTVPRYLRLEGHSLGPDKKSGIQTLFTTAPFSHIQMAPSDCSITPGTSTTSKRNNFTNR